MKTLLLNTYLGSQVQEKYYLKDDLNNFKHSIEYMDIIYMEFVLCLISKRTYYDCEDVVQYDEN